MNLIKTKLFASINITASKSSFHQNSEVISHELQKFFDLSRISYDVAKVCSINERTEKYQIGKRLNYTYGEVTLGSMASIFDSIKSHGSQSNSGIFDGNNPKIFYDLGSGSGVPVYIAGMLYPFQECCGIEILCSLHDLAMQGKLIWDTSYQLKYISSMSFYCGSITDLTIKNWTDGDIILANSTCFDDSLLNSIESIASMYLKQGAYMITFSKQFQTEYFELIEELRLPMSWGEADVFIHQKNAKRPTTFNNVNNINNTIVSRKFTGNTDNTNTIITYSNNSINSPNNLSISSPSISTTTDDITLQNTDINTQGNTDNTNINTNINNNNNIKKSYSITIPYNQTTLRIICISDTHDRHEAIRNLPPGDILIHSGDFSSNGRPNSIAKFYKWLHDQSYSLKINVAGNHDLTLHEEFYNHLGGRERFHGHVKPPYDSKYCKSLVYDYSDVIYLEDESLLLNIYQTPENINLPPKLLTQLKVHGSPWQPTFYDWAFNLDRGADILAKWKLIPSDTDILITHGPPYQYGDRCMNGFHAGCLDLWNEITTRITPKIHIFGHIHEAYGVTAYDHKSGTDISMKIHEYSQKMTAIKDNTVGNTVIASSDPDSCNFIATSKNTQSDDNTNDLSPTDTISDTCTTNTMQIHDSILANYSRESTTVFVNACTCTYRYHPTNPPILLNYPLNSNNLPYYDTSIP